VKLFSVQYWNVLPDNTFWTWCALALATGGGGLYWFLRSVLRARVISDVPTSRIRSAPQGYVELIGTGRALQGPPIVSPLSGQRCLWYSYQIEERESYGNSGERGWKTIERATSDGLFSIEDGTGICIIDPEGAQVIPHVDRRWHGNSREPLTGLHVFSRGRYRFREQRLEQDWPLYAIGEFHTLGIPIPDNGAESAALLRDLKRNPQRMKAFDRNADGQIDEQEWELARYWAKREVQRRAVEEPPPEAHSLLSRGNGAYAYILSGKSEEELVRGYRWHALAGLVALLAGLPMAIWMLLARFAT
jgi:hypothetical protein